MRRLVVFVITVVGLLQFGSANPAGASGCNRTTSSPPISAVADLAFDPGDEETLTWTFYVNGDYDQNGETNISDLTPIGLHFGETSGSHDWQTSRVADGDDNGEVNIADITPIGLNMGLRVTGFLVVQGGSETGPFTAVPGALVEFSSAPVPPGGGPRQFTFSLPSPVTGNYFAVVAVDGPDLAASYSNAVQYVSSNQPPVAVIYTDDPTEIFAGTTIHFDGSGSYDTDGTVDLYEWDPEGTGDFVGTGSTPGFDYLYPNPGTFTPVLRVTDNNGATATDTGDPVSVSSNQMPVAVIYTNDPTEIIPGTTIHFYGTGSYDNDGTVDWYEWDPEGTGDFLAAGSTPELNYIYTNPGIFTPVLRVTDNNGAKATGTGDPVTVTFGDVRLDLLDSAGETGWEVAAVTMSTGEPCAAYTALDGVPMLKFVRASSPAADIWHAPQILHNNKGVNYVTMARVTNGSLVVSAAWSSGEVVNYGGTADGSVWGGWAVVRFPDANDYGMHLTSMAVGDGSILGYEDDTGGIWVSYYDNPSWVHTKVSPFAVVGEFPSLCFAANVPSMVYGHAAAVLEVDLYFTMSENTAGTAWNDPLVVEASGDITTSSRSMVQLWSALSESMAVYYNDAEQKLQARSYLFTDGSYSWTDPVILDSLAQVDHYFWVSLVNTLPMVAYADSLTNEVRLAVARDRLGLEWNDPIMVTSNSSGYSSIALVQREDLPLVFYHDKGTHKLMAAVYH